MFHHRFRDVDKDIRTMCMEEIRVWFSDVPDLWIEDSSLRFCGFMIHDLEASVRLAAIQAITGILASGNDVAIGKTQKFIEKFKDRLLEMVEDIDDDVVAATIELLSHLLRKGELSEDQGSNVPTLIWDANENVRLRAAEFVFQDTFVDEIEKQNHQDDISQLLNVFDKYCPIKSKGEIEQEETT